MIVAKNSTEKVTETSANKTDEANANSQLPTPEMFADGLGVSASTPKSRIVGRKGVDMADLTPVATSSTNVTQLANSTTSTTTLATTTSSKVTSTTIKPPTTTQSTTTSTIKVTTTTKKPVRKPTITYSADDNPDILASEKKINFNATKSDEVPKTSPDLDRSLIDEQRTRNSYVFFMGLLFGIPMTITLVHVLYKKIKAWREIRHYQRVVS
jgi:hypothetical protein